MRSAAAEHLREGRRSREAKTTPGEQVQLALLLGERDLRAFASAQGLSLREAHRRLRRAAQAGRVPSGAAIDPADP